MRRFFAFLVLIGGMLVLSLPVQATESTQSANEDTMLTLTLKEGQVRIQLRPDLAPKHVQQIQQLVRDGAYNHVVFHRVIEGFMAQTGDVEFGQKGAPHFDPARAGRGKSNYPNLPAEFSPEPFVRGTVGMARSFQPNSANSQFFICFVAAPFLNGQYTVVGSVIDGMDVIDKIKTGSKEKNGSVVDPDEIIKAQLGAYH